MIYISRIADQIAAPSIESLAIISLLLLNSFPLGHIVYAYHINLVRKIFDFDEIFAGYFYFKTLKSSIYNYKKLLPNPKKVHFKTVKIFFQILSPKVSLF